MAEIINLEQIKQVAEATNGTKVVNLGDFFSEGTNLYTNSKGNIVQFSEISEGLTGGTKTGVTAFDVIEGGQSGAPIYELKPKAQVGEMSGASAISSVLNGLGIAVGVEVLSNPDIWEWFAQKMFPESETVQEALDTLEKYTEPVYYINKHAYDPSLDPDWATYMDEEFVEKIIDIANEGGYTIAEQTFIPEEVPAGVNSVLFKANPMWQDSASYVRSSNESRWNEKYPTFGSIHRPHYTSVFANGEKRAEVEAGIQTLISEFVQKYGIEPNCWVVSGAGEWQGYNDQYTQPTGAWSTYSLECYYVETDTPTPIIEWTINGEGILNSNYYKRGNHSLSISYHQAWGSQTPGGSDTWYIDYSDVSISGLYTATDIHVNYSTTDLGGRKSLSCMLETIDPKEGIKPIQNANIYDPSQSLVQNFPAWVGDRQSVAIIENGALAGQNVLPIGVPYVDPMVNPQKYPSELPYVNPSPAPAPEVNPQTQVQTGTPTIPVPNDHPYSPYKPVPNNVQDPAGKPVPTPSTPTPPPATDTPVIVPPLVGGSSNKLFTVYNPSQSNLDSLGAYLWDADILRELVEFFTNNPMDAIISLHQIYCTPTTGGSKNIKLGYLNTGISSPVVSNQYTYIDCGSISVPEFYGSVLDYAPYTEINIFLPFIGVKPLDVNLVMASMVSVKYAIDVFTGACLCTIDITKRGAKVTTYHFDGNCSIQLPLTGADRSRLLSGVLSMATVGFGLGGVGGAVVGGVAGGVTNMKANIQKSGTIGSNVGAMDIKVPYLVVTRNLSYEPSSYNRLYGIPSNKYVRLSQCGGYTRVKDVHTDNISGATQSEKASIENILKQGIIIQ